MNTADKTAIEMASYQDDVTRVTLDQPIEIGGTLVTEVMVTKPKSGALMGLSLARLLNDADFDTICKIVPRCTSPQITALHIKNDLVGLRDLTRIHGEICAFFMTKSDREALPRIS